jgi:hypothetical protein
MIRPQGRTFVSRSLMACPLYMWARLRAARKRLSRVYSQIKRCLQVETKLDFVINLKIAMALGLTAPLTRKSLPTK